MDLKRLNPFIPQNPKSEFGRTLDTLYRSIRSFVDIVWTNPEDPYQRKTMYQLYIATAVLWLRIQVDSKYAKELDAIRVRLNEMARDSAGVDKRK